MDKKQTVGTSSTFAVASLLATALCGTSVCTGLTGCASSDAAGRFPNFFAKRQSTEPELPVYDGGAQTAASTDMTQPNQTAATGSSGHTAATAQASYASQDRVGPSTPEPTNVQLASTVTRQDPALPPPGMATSSKASNRVQVPPNSRSSERTVEPQQEQQLLSAAAALPVAAKAATNRPAANRPAPLVTLGPGQSLASVIDAAPGNVLIDFYADWCGPCKKQGRILHELESTAQQAGATIVKVNVDEHPDLQKQFNVKALPTLVVLKNGQLVQRQKGLTDRSKIESWLTN